MIQSFAVELAKTLGVSRRQKSHPFLPWLQVFQLVTVIHFLSLRQTPKISQLSKG